MRHLILMAAFTLSSTAAMAGGSIDVVTTRAQTSGGSIIAETCVSCPALKEDIRKKDYTVPTLKEGTQTVEIRDIDGKKKIVRTEAWMGGSPVVFVSSAPSETALAAAPEAIMPVDGIDTSATTSAISSTAQPVEAALVGDSHPGPLEQNAPLDVSDFNMRLQ